MKDGGKKSATQKLYKSMQKHNIKNKINTSRAG